MRQYLSVFPTAMSSPNPGMTTTADVEKGQANHVAMPDTDCKAAIIRADQVLVQPEALTKGRVKSKACRRFLHAILITISILFLAHCFVPHLVNSILFRLRWRLQLTHTAL